jgi:hypothetical protein
MFNPLEEKRNARYTRQELKEFWQGPGVVVQRLRTENPALYAELHAEGERAGVVGKSMAPNPAPNTPYKPPTKTYTAGELAARGRHSETYCRELFASGDGRAARELHETDREGYEDAKDSAIAYGILPPRSTPRPAPAPVAAPKFTLGFPTS